MSNPMDNEERKGDEVLKRMLKTPPDPKTKGDDPSRRPPKSHQDLEDGRNAE